MKVKEIMTKKVVTVEENTPVSKVAELLFKHGFTGMPVVNKKKKVLGIVTESDLIMQEARLHLPSYLQILDSILYLESPRKMEDELKKILALTAKDLMTTPVYTISPEDSVENLATLIKDKHINPVPVVKGGKLAGIVSRADLVKLLAKKL